MLYLGRGAPGFAFSVAGAGSPRPCGQRAMPVSAARSGRGSELPPAFACGRSPSGRFAFQRCRPGLPSTHVALDRSPPRHVRSRLPPDRSPPVRVASALLSVEISSPLAARLRGSAASTSTFGFASFRFLQTPVRRHPPLGPDRPFDPARSSVPDPRIRPVPSGPGPRSPPQFPASARSVRSRKLSRFPSRRKP